MVKKNGKEITGATDAVLRIENVSANDAGNYTVIIKNSIGNVTSNETTLTVK